MLLRIAVADHRLLDEPRSILCDLVPTLLGEQKQNAPHLPKLDGDTGVDCIERFLDRNNIRLKTLDHRRNAFGYVCQTLRERLPRIRLHDAELGARRFYTAARESSPV